MPSRGGGSSSSRTCRTPSRPTRSCAPIAPGDREAIDRLKELYAKRRAYKPLFELLGAEAASDAGRRRAAASSGLEMAKLAAERLDMGAQAVALYKQVLDEDPSSAGALDALEKQAERDKDFADRGRGARAARGRGAPTTATRLSVLQKLGASTPTACTIMPRR